MSSPKPISARRAMMTGAAWTIGMRFGVKGLGFLSTVILARLIMPSEYAVVAMAMLVVGLLDSFIDLGADIAVLRKDEIDRPFIDSAWTLRLLQGFLIAGLLVAVAPIAVAYFEDDRVGPVLWVLAGCVAVGSTGNIGLVIARKELQFALDFKIQISCKVLQVLVTAGAAYFLRDYRALVLGVATGYLSGWLLSYVMHPYRPRWNTRCFGEIWMVTRWLMLSNMMIYLVRKTDELAAGRIGTSHEFGLYNVGADLGKLPTSEIGPALLRVLLPVLSSIQKDADRVRAGVSKVMTILSSVMLPAGFGVAAIATPFVLVILGPNWLDAAPIVGLFGIVGALQSLSQPMSTFLTLRGFTKIQSSVVWYEFLTFCISALFWVPHLGLLGLILARMTGAIVSFSLYSFECKRRCALPLQHTFGTAWRPLVCALVMYACVNHALTLSDSPPIQLFFGLSVGVATYAMTMLFSWLLIGRPEGLESEVIGYVRHRYLRD